MTVCFLDYIGNSLVGILDTSAFNFLFSRAGSHRVFSICPRRQSKLLIFSICWNNVDTIFFGTNPNTYFSKQNTGECLYFFVSIWFGTFTVDCLRNRCFSNCGPCAYRRGTMEYFLCFAIFQKRTSNHYSSTCSIFTTSSNTTTKTIVGHVFQDRLKKISPPFRISHRTLI